MSERKSGLFVTPGERLGVIEEFIGGSGTYTHHGIIYSRISGRTLLDILNKEVSIYPLVQTATVPKLDDIVFGQVLEVRNNKAILKILQIGKKSLSGSFASVLHISDVRKGYVETMFDVCKKGDVIKAKVISNKNRTIHLSIADKDLGIIYALCSRCGQVLQRGKRGSMQCSRCGNIEKRKIAPNYGKWGVQESERDAN